MFSSSIRQSSAYQVIHNLESQKLQYAMRERLVDYARSRATKRRAGDEQGRLQPLTTGVQVETKAPLAPVELLDLDALAEADKTLA